MARRNYLIEVQHLLLWGMFAGTFEGTVSSVIAAKTFGAAPPEERSQWFMDRMHLNAAGNCILAQAIERELERANLLPPQD